MSINTSELTRHVQENRHWVEPLVNEVGRVVVGQKILVHRLLIGLLSNGHVLLEGVPGLAKTLTVRTLANSIRTGFQRLQFTPDLLPADLVGTMIYNPRESVFTTKLGPIFSNLILADEINRAPAKVQSALLEAMQERQVTIGEETFPLPDPFLVLATQNPIEQEGTYPLPEAQLDRFLFNVLLDYLSADEEVKVIERFTKTVEMPKVEACTSAEEIVQFQALVRQVPISASLSRYAVDIVRATRPSDPIAPEIIRKYANFGSSIRATMNLVLAAKARALMEGRYHVTAEDLKKLAPPILRHRVLPNYFAESDGVTIDKILADMLESLPVPAAE
mgnify:CR=1 FL=1